jgi:hypothetical protein
MNLIKTLTRYAFYTVLCLVFFSCEQSKISTKSPTDRFNNLKKPVTLFGKSESNWCDGCWGVELMDGGGKVHSFGNATQIGNAIGVHYKVGDTLAKNK